MTTQLGGSLVERQSINRPLFNGSNYIYWKAHMHIFIQALDYDMWSIIINRPHTLTIIVNGIASPKLEKDWNEMDKKLA